VNPTCLTSVKLRVGPMMRHNVPAVGWVTAKLSRFGLQCPIRAFIVNPPSTHYGDVFMRFFPSPRKDGFQPLSEASRRPVDAVEASQRRKYPVHSVRSIQSGSIGNRFQMTDSWLSQSSLMAAGGRCCHREDYFRRLAIWNRDTDRHSIPVKHTRRKSSGNGSDRFRLNRRRNFPSQ
jgi:hypothetical protein